jgi:hypothetical protein
MVNLEKSSVLFSANTQQEDRAKVKERLNITGEARNEKYLGLPVYMGRSKTKTFAYLKDRIWKKIQGWKENFLSKAGKEILIKAVAQAMPTYAMSCFDLTKTLCDEIGRMVARYWWANMDNERKMHWVSWEKMCIRKEEGGMGFRDLYLFNLAMLARQAWRLITVEESLCAQVLRAKYYMNGNLLSAVERLGISYSWRSILRGVQAMKEGLIWRIGNGHNVNIWLDPWIPNAATRRPCTPQGRNVITRVDDLLDPGTGTWDTQLVQDIFWKMDADIILTIPVRMDHNDYVAWHSDGKGIFSVKSAYHVLKDKEEAKGKKQVGESFSGARTGRLEWKKLWKKKCRPKILQFIWRLAHNSLPLRRNIKHRGMEADTVCPVCHRLDEDAGHLLLKCKQVKQCWRQLNLEKERNVLIMARTGEEFIQQILLYDDPKVALVFTFLWVWWTARNKANQGDGMATTHEILHRVYNMMAAEGQEEKKEATARNARSLHHHKWLPPDEGVLKINCDGAFVQSTKKGAWGFVTRDHEHTAIAVGAGHLDYVWDTMQAEAQACLEALRAAQALGISHIHL